ncbi:HAD-IIB family hydrolase [Alloalcanivorax mobilis]|uniref:HAD-IIB family hydrolase n=1 Tax=Alloalcanivorax mobilis TaxID=2019569 RepID=UPI000C7851AC|nr:mannosyl-3-phosphoglycerate phosphatase [Alloalcanivorax mobilis]
MSITPRLVFTDLDGSLLDHYDYNWSTAEPWLARLAAAGVAVIPVTSTTRAELLDLRAALALQASPFVAENGAVIGLPAAWCDAALGEVAAADSGLWIRTPGLDVATLRQRLDQVRRRLAVKFRRFGELPMGEVMALTGLPRAAAERARAREGSEPLIWEDRDPALADFREALAGQGLTLTRGGRFWHVMGQVDKGRAVHWLTERFTALHGRAPLTLGLGDGPNDQPFLDVVDQAVLIRGEHSHPVTINNPALYRTRLPGPRGWAEGLDHWLAETPL